MLIFAAVVRIVYTTEYYVSREINIISSCVTSLTAASVRVRARFARARAQCSVGDKAKRSEAGTTTKTRFNSILFNLIHYPAPLWAER